MCTVNGIIISLLLIVIPYFELLSGTGATTKDDVNNIQRSPTGIFDYQKNTLSNVDFLNTNFGIFGYDSKYSVGSVYWPRGSDNLYIFASGVWFGAMKPFGSEGELRKYCSISYNPNNGRSWYVPGRVEDGDLIDSTNFGNYRIYFSTDFDKLTGKPFKPEDGTYWPIWDNSIPDVLKENNYYGRFIRNTTERNKNTYPKGPAFISDEDVFCSYKDTDLNQYDAGAIYRKSVGYPLKLQYEQTIYSWDSDYYKDILIFRYDIINKSFDTLFNCWFAPVYDADIATKQNAQAGASNDRCRYFVEADTFKLAVNWSNSDQREEGKGFGYAGYEFLQSPAIKQCEKIVYTEIDGVYDDYCFQCTGWKMENGIEVCTDSILFKQDNIDFLRNDKRKFTNREQLGLRTFRNWPIELDPKEDDERYHFISSKVKDGDNGPGDKRILFATGPFNMLPGDTASVWVGIVFALPAVNVEPDGATDDIGLKDGSIIKNSLLDKVLISRELFNSGLVVGVNSEEFKSIGKTLIKSIYPNPATEFVYIELLGTGTIPRSFEIYNMQGEIQVRKEFMQIDSDLFKIDLSVLAAGVYVLKIGCNNEYFYSKICIVK